MEHSRPSLSPLKALADHWCLFALMAVALGRHVSMMNKLGAHRGAAQAELLEAWAYHALVQLSLQIAEHSRGGKLSPEDAKALAYLKTVYTCLALLALLMSQIKLDLSAAKDGWARHNQFAGAAHIAWPEAPARQPAIIDTS